MNTHMFKRRKESDRVGVWDMKCWGEPSIATWVQILE